MSGFLCKLKVPDFVLVEEKVPQGVLDEEQPVGSSERYFPVRPFTSKFTLAVFIKFNDRGVVLQSLIKGAVKAVVICVVDLVIVPELLS